MGLIVEVLEGQHSGSGVFGNVKALTVVNVEGPFDPAPGRPAAFLEKGPLGSVRVVPVEKPSQPIAHGGRYVATSDSRFGRALEKLGYPSHCAVALHDYLI